MNPLSPDFHRLVHQLSYAEPASPAALRALVEAGEAAIAPLAEAVRAGDAGTRLRAARALAEIGGAAVTGPLAEALLDPDIAVRRVAVDGLTAIGEPAIEPLCRLAAAESEADLVPVYQVLVRIGSPAMQQLLPGLSRARGRYRETIIQVLAEMADPAAISPLCRMLESSYPSGELARQVAEALTRIAEIQPAPELRNALPILRRFLPPWYFSNPRELKAFSTAIREIETRTHALQQMPLPANQPGAGHGMLPLPAEPGPAKAETLPIPTDAAAETPEAPAPPGWRQRLWRARR